MTTKHHRFFRRPGFFPKRTDRCGGCGTRVAGAARRIAGKPRCYWCLKRTGLL